MENSKTCSSKSPWAREGISSKFIDNLGTRPQNGLPALLCDRRHFVPRNADSKKYCI